VKNHAEQAFDFLLTSQSSINNMSNAKQKTERIEFVSDTGRPISLSKRFDLICEELRNLLAEDERRWEPDQEFTGGLNSVISEFLYEVQEHNDYDPTPQFLYDNDGGEPPVTADEMWQTDFRKKQEFHS
jgi:hypothetical protein